MIIFLNGNYEYCSDFPDTLYNKDAKYCIPDSSELAAKYIALYPRAQLVTDDSGNVVDVTEIPKTEEEVTAEKRAAYEAASVAYIRERYSQDDENKVIREYLANPANKAEFDEYNSYVMECKSRAKAEIFDGEGV